MKTYKVLVTTLCTLCFIKTESHVRNPEPPPEIFTLDPNTNILVACNSSASQAAVLDYKYNISSLFNGKTGAAFAFNYEIQKAAYIPGGVFSNTWYQSQETFSQYFGNLPSQTTLWNLGEKYGTVFDASSITTDLSNEITKILLPLTADFSDPCDAYANYLRVSKITSDALKSPLRGFTEVMGGVRSQVRGDFRWLVGVFQGSGALFGSIRGGFDLLSRKGVSLDFGKMLTSATAFDTLIYILTELKPYINVGEALGHVLNRSERFFSLASQLGGAIEYGTDGFNNVIHEILTYIAGETSRQNLEITLTKFLKSPKTSITVTRKEWPDAVRHLLDSVKNLNLVEALPGLTKLLNNILHRTWFEKGVNMSRIIHTIFEEYHTSSDPVAIVLKCIDQEMRSAKLDNN